MKAMLAIVAVCAACASPTVTQNVPDVSGDWFGTVPAYEQLAALNNDAVPGIVPNVWHIRLQQFEELLVGLARVEGAVPQALEVVGEVKPDGTVYLGMTPVGIGDRIGYRGTLNGETLTLEREGAFWPIVLKR